MKKIISIALVLVLIFSVSASAEGWRIYPSKTSKEKIDKSSYVAYWDFTDVDEGMFPAGVSGNRAEVSTAIHNVDGKKKNCLQIVDNDHSKTWTGIQANFTVPPTSGLVEFKIRYKYIKPSSGESTYAQFTQYAYDSTGQQLSYMVTSSVNGATRFNPGGNGECDLEPQMLANDTWYTLTYVFDFDKDEMDVELVNEGIGAYYNKMKTKLFSDAGGKDLAKFNFGSQCYGGTFVIDYAYVKKTDKRMQLNRDYLKGIKKGVAQIKTPAPISLAYAERINIVKDGVYKYTTKAPYVSENGNVMVTAKNIADILDLGYDIKNGKYILNKGETKLTFTAGDAAGLSEAPVFKDGQLFVAIKDVLDALGMAYTLEADTLTIG